MKRPILILFAILFIAGIAAADEGMWLYNLPSHGAAQGQIQVRSHAGLARPYPALLRPLQ